MANYHRHRRRRLTGTTVILILIGAALIYAGILLGIRLIGNRLEGTEAVEPVGSLEGRFVSNGPTMQYTGRDWTYRKRDLTNILLIGVDWQESGAIVSGADAGQADLLYLITIDKKNKTVSTLRLDRNTVTDIRIYSPLGEYTGIRKTRLGLSHTYGATAAENCDNTVWAVSNLLGNIPVDGYLALDTGAIAALKDALGKAGITPEEDSSTPDAQMSTDAGLTLHAQEGRDDEADASSARQQHSLIQAAVEMFFQGVSDRMSAAGKLFEALTGHMTTNRQRAWFINKAYECRDYRQLETKSLAGSHSLSADGITEFHPDADALNALLTACFFE